MERVIAERTMPAPMTAAEVRESIRTGGSCDDLYGVTHCGSVLAPDGRRVVCFYRAPDAEAVRATSRQHGVPYDRIWSASLLGPLASDVLTMLPESALTDPASAEGARAPVLVRRVFEEPVAIENLEAREADHAWCLQAYGVRFLQTFLARDRRRMLCLYAAPDAEAVRHVQRQAGMPFESAWTVTLCRP